MGSSATANPFSLLGDNENSDPIKLAAAVPQKPKAKPVVAAEPKPSALSTDLGTYAASHCSHIAASNV
jgi:hypothetical protein